MHDDDPPPDITLFTLTMVVARELFAIIGLAATIVWAVYAMITGDMLWFANTP